MTRWRCTVCGYIYDEAVGEPSTGTAPGTPFAALPDDWRCPVCGAAKDAFVMVDETSGTGERTVADLVMAELAAFGVRYVFGIPGTSSLGLVDAVRRNPDLEYIVVRHEGNGAMAASAYHKLTGVPAACLTIGGPGATNLATGLYDAKEDHAAVIALAGQVEFQYAGPGGFQEIDQDAFFRPIAVYNATIHDPAKAVQIVTAAVKHALIERGVAQISVPNNVQKLAFDAPYCSGASCLPETAIAPPAAALDRAVEALAKAERPVILAGWGAYTHGGLVHALAKRLSAPILTTFRAKGFLPEKAELVVGVLGNLGPPEARQYAEEADLLVTLGVGFSKQTNVPLDRADRPGRPRPAQAREDAADDRALGRLRRRPAPPPRARPRAAGRSAGDERSRPARHGGRRSSRPRPAPARRRSGRRSSCRCSRRCCRRTR